jgi:spermidine/putrescine transport system substrate-binding protein
MVEKKTKILGLAGVCAATLVFFTGCRTENQTSSKVPVLRVLTWSDYLSPETITAFEKAESAQVKLDYFSSNEELLAKVQASVKGGGAGYDIVFPSDYMVSSLVQLQLVQKLNPSELNFLTDLDPAFRSPPYNPGLTHAVPFAWGTTGIAINTRLTKGFSGPVSWKQFFEDPRFKGQVTVLDDTKEVFHAALHVLGRKWEEANEQDIKAAFEYLKLHKKNIKLFTAQTKPVIEAGECALCMVYSGDGLQVGSEKAEIRYVLPQEGATVWSDNLAIPVNATQVKLAHQFMNHLLNAQNAKTFTEATFFASPNQKANALVSSELRQNAAVFPGPNEMKRLSFLTDRPELLPILDRYWTELKAQ